MLLRADREFAHVEEEIQKQMSKFAGKNGPSSPFDPRQLKLRDENDKPVSPDAVVNEIVRNASDTLVMLAYIHRWFDEGGSIVLPTDVSVDDKIAYKAGMYSLAACQWRYLTDAWDRSRLFGVRFQIREQEFQAKQGGTRQCTLLEVQSSGELELMDRIALNRVEQAFFEIQMGFEIIAGNASRSEEKQGDTATLPKASYLTPEERASTEILDCSYCLSIDDDSIVVGGLRIKVWLRGYAYFGRKARCGWKS